MEIVQFKRQQEHHQAHLNRIRNITAVLDTSKPESLGLKHLALRPKKMQLVEDRRQMVAKENAKLMKLMTDIMNEKRKQPKHLRPASLNEVERKREVDRLNFENSLLMKRLTKIAPVIDNSKLETDFKRHLHAEANLRRRQMKPLALPKDLHPNSPLRKSQNEYTDTMGLFDSSLYTTQRGQFMNGSSLESLQSIGDAKSPIKSVTDFRREVIASKKLSSPSQSLHLGESRMSLEGGDSLELLSKPPTKTMSAKNAMRGDVVMELKYAPKSS